MANEICVCNDGLLNTGLPLCESLQKVIKKVIFVQLISNGGVLNSIDPSNTNDLDWVTALINNTDKSLRWFPTPEIKNIDTPKGDPVFEKYEDDSSNFVRESVRKFTGLIPTCPPLYKAKLESVRCNNNTGVFLIDIEGNIIGLKNGDDGLLYPMPINAQSLVGKSVFGNDKSTTSIMLEFEFPASMQDADVRMITGGSFPDFSPLSIAGLLDANAVVSGISTTGFDIAITTPSPALDSPIAVQGLVTADFVGFISNAASKIYNLTDTADLTVTVSETSAGVYHVAYAAQTSADVLKIKIKKEGFDMTNINPANNPIAIP